MRDARIAGNALVAEVGIAASTCLGRVRALRGAGVSRWYHADLDPDAIEVALTGTNLIVDRVPGLGGEL